MSFSRISSRLNPGSSLVSTLIFLSQFQLVNAKDKEDSSLPFLFIPTGIAWLVCLPLVCSSERRNQEQQQAVEITPLFGRENKNVINYTASHEEVVLSSYNETPTPVKEEVITLTQENSSVNRFKV